MRGIEERRRGTSRIRETVEARSVRRESELEREWSKGREAALGRREALLGSEEVDDVGVGGRGGRGAAALVYVSFLLPNVLTVGHGLTMSWGPSGWWG